MKYKILLLAYLGCPLIGMEADQHYFKRQRITPPEELDQIETPPAQKKHRLSSSEEPSLAMRIHNCSEDQTPISFAEWLHIFPEISRDEKQDIPGRLTTSGLLYFFSKFPRELIALVNSYILKDIHPLMFDMNTGLSATKLTTAHTTSHYKVTREKTEEKTTLLLECSRCDRCKRTFESNEKYYRRESPHNPISLNPFENHFKNGYNADILIMILTTDNKVIIAGHDRIVYEWDIGSLLKLKKMIRSRFILEDSIFLRLFLLNGPLLKEEQYRDDLYSRIKYFHDRIKARKNALLATTS